MMNNLRVAGIALLALAIAIGLWGLKRQLSPIAHPVTFGVFAAALILTCIIGALLCSEGIEWRGRGNTDELDNRS